MALQHQGCPSGLRLAISEYKLPGAGRGHTSYACKHETIIDITLLLMVAWNSKQLCKVGNETSSPQTVQHLLTHEEV